ncbi:hypothetical protein GOP47_0016198 [Adiantum capillus-veneris]|uniref:Uncharacterized protein n=1 Tax=Adiantum capillus-veneris TaxID=13818 RepID=A0A9D4ZA26_ADICA|nr:hypothetical protein GOP47_0016198 [Adiantum capillus-veneris]
MTVGTRSGGDALKKQELLVPLLQTLDEKATKLQHFWNGRFEVMTNKVDKHGIGDACWIEDLKECPVYYPTKEDFVEDPLCYIRKIAAEASKYGICKIVSPVIASVPAGVVLSKEQSGFRFTTRIQPMRISNWDNDDKVAFPIKGRHYTLTEYEKVANRVFSRKFSTAAGLPPRFIESAFWKELAGGKTRTVEYATDVDGSAFSTSKTDPLGQSKWNLKGISRLPDSTLRLLEEAIPGVTEPMLYIGMLFSMFAWHVEDHFLYSINYQHCGAPKTWYGVPGDAASHFEKVVKEHVYSRELLNDTGKGAELDLLLGKTTMFAPKLLIDHELPVFKAVQYPGEFIITFPRAYHAGFSHGFNCGEAVNFAMADWFPFGAEASLRYECLNRSPLLPHDELLCKEARHIECNDQIGHTNSFCKQQACIMMAFVALMQFHQQVKTDLERQGAKTTTSNVVDVSCGLCKHKCYVGYTHCKCFSEPTCFNHGDFFSSCSCEADRTVCLRDDFASLQFAAQKYEHEQEIRKQAQLLLDGDTAQQGDSAPFRGTSECLESSLLTNATPSVREPCYRQEGREAACSENVFSNLETSGVFNCREAQDEEGAESDTEVLKIKRRRVTSPQSRRFQVDEYEIDKSLVRSLDFGIVLPLRNCDGLERLEHTMLDKQEYIEPASLMNRGIVLPSRDCDGLERQEHTMLDKQDYIKPASVMNRDLISVCHVIDELNIKGSAAAVMSQWQNDARRQGLILKIKEVIVRKENMKVLSLKGLLCLKHLVSKEEAKVLQRLISKVKSRRNGFGHRYLCPTSASLDTWSSANAIRNRENCNEKRGSSCMITTVRYMQLTAPTKDCALPGEMHSESDKKPSAESKNIEGLSLVAGSTILSAQCVLQELQDVQVSAVSVVDEEASKVNVALDALCPKDVLGDPELTRVKGGRIREEESSSSEPVSMEPEPLGPLTEISNTEDRESLNLQRIVSRPAAELERCNPILSHIENAMQPAGTGLAGEGRLCDTEEVCGQSDKSSQVMGISNTLTNPPAEAQPLVDGELSGERNIETGPTATANAGESSTDHSKRDIQTDSPSLPKRGLVIYLNRKVEQCQEKGAKFSHDQDKIEDDYDEVDIFEGQTGANAWCLDTSLGTIQNDQELIPPLEQLTSTCGDDFLHHHLEGNGAQGHFACSSNIKTDRSSEGGELSVMGHHHGKSMCSQVSSEYSNGELGHDVIKLCSNSEPNYSPLGRQQIFTEEDHNLDSIKPISRTADAQSGKQQKTELSCKTLEFPAGLRNNSYAGLDVHASRFGNSSYWRETSRYNGVEKPLLNTAQRYGGSKTDPYAGQSTHWGCSQQGHYDFSPHLPAGQKSFRNNGGKFKRRMGSSLYQEHHPYGRDVYRSTNYPRPFHDKEHLPCGYWKRKSIRNYSEGWKDAKSISVSAEDRQQTKRVLGRHAAESSSSTFKGTGYVEAYDPVRWEIPANYWHLQSSTDHHHVHPSFADIRGLPRGL